MSFLNMSFLNMIFTKIFFVLYASYLMIIKIKVKI